MIRFIVITGTAGIIREAGAACRIITITRHRFSSDLTITTIMDIPTSHITITLTEKEREIFTG